MAIGPTLFDLWQRNNNVRQLPPASDQDRLTLRENWGQIATGGRDFLQFRRVDAPSWELLGCAAHRGCREQGRSGTAAG
jgi:hypothetical protein